mgnify:CR=1 FL=1
MLDNGQTFKVETRRYDDKLGKTVLMRVKETGNDYRYFPEPDIPYLYVTDEMIERVVKTIPMLPDERRKIYIEKIKIIVSARGSFNIDDEIIKSEWLTKYKDQFIVIKPDSEAFAISSSEIRNRFMANEDYSNLMDTNTYNILKLSYSVKIFF